MKVKMSEQAHDIAPYATDKKSTLDYLLLVGGWFVSFFSLVIIVLISYWAIKIDIHSKIKCINDSSSLF